jgi:hypothetical protein
MIIAYDDNGVSKEREATAAEKKIIIAAQADAAITKEIEIAEAQARATAKAALLDKLGITVDEAKLLLG